MYQFHSLARRSSVIHLYLPLCAHTAHSSCVQSVMRHKSVEHRRFGLCIFIFLGCDAPIRIQFHGLHTTVPRANRPSVVVWRWLITAKCNKIYGQWDVPVCARPPTVHSNDIVDRRRTVDSLSNEKQHINTRPPAADEKHCAASQIRTFCVFHKMYTHPFHADTDTSATSFRMP